MQPERRPEPAPPDPECERTRSSISRFVQEGVRRRGADDAELRAHVTACAACRDVYRSALASAARLGRAMRDARETEERARRRSENRARAIAGGVSSAGRSGRRFGLRLALLPAVLAVLATQVHRLGPSTLAVSVEELARDGEVQVAGRKVSPGESSAEMEVGDWCLALGESRVRVEGDSGTLWLTGETHLLVEDPVDGRVRLQRGALEVQGGWVVATQVGVVLIEGSARIRYSGGELTVEGLEGEVELLQAAGRKRIPAGRTAIASLAEVRLVRL